MTAITLWLLVSVGTGYFGAGATPTITVARFETAHECEKTRSQLLGAFESYKPRLVCVSAQVVKP